MSPPTTSATVPGGRQSNLRLGIVAWLVLAFTALGIFVLFADALTLRETLIVYSERAAAKPAPVPVPNGSSARAGASVDTATVAPVKMRVQPGQDAERDAAARLRALEESLNRLRDATDARLRAPTDESPAAYQRAMKAVTSAAGHVSARSLGRRARALAESTDELVSGFDTRASQYESARERFDALQAQIDDAVTKSWKVLGRVVIRQSLKEIDQEINAIRVLVPSLGSIGGYTPQTVETLEQREAELGALITRYEKQLRRSQGDAWLEALEANVAEALRGRQDLVATDLRLETLRKDIERSHGTLKRDISAALAAAAAAAESAAAAAASAAETGLLTGAGDGDPDSGGRETAPRTAAGSPGADAALQSSPNVEPASAGRVRVDQTLAGEEARDGLRIGAAVLLLLLLALSLGLAAGIVRPIRRLVDASARLAAGAPGAVGVPRASIRELDTLGLAFNQMADQLASARELANGYQRTLEERVRQRTAQLQHLADHDPLTDLPNRRRAVAYLDAAIARARDTGGAVGVFFLDLDNFKNLNETLGHANGDRLLQSVAERLVEAVAPTGFAARLGGDEFAVIHAGTSGIEEIRAAGWNLVKAFQRPLRVEQHDILVSVSVGASSFPAHDQDAEALLRDADAALFRAKQMGRSQLALYTPELLEIAAAKFTTEQGLRRAVERGEFELLFQPEVDATTCEVNLVEALLRWRTPDGSLASPGTFLAVAEESGLIMEISDWVMRSAIEAAAAWHRAGHTRLRVAINVSPRQLLDPGFVDVVSGHLERNALSPSCIEIELTENVIQTGEATIAALHELRRRGIGIALDDFGTGYSSLASLEQLPLTRVKLDRSLIDGLDSSDRARAIVRALMGLCRDWGLEMTAEGIERDAQLVPLLGTAHLNLQGYRIARPLPATEVAGFVWHPPDLPARLDVADTEASLVLHAQWEERERLATG